MLQQRLDLYLLESGKLEFPGMPDDVFLRINASLTMSVPFVPYIGLMVLPPCRCDDDENCEWEIKDLVWDGDCEEFRSECDYSGPEELTPDGDSYTVHDWVKNRTRMGWEVWLRKWTFHDDRPMQDEPISLDELTAFVQEHSRATT